MVDVIVRGGTVVDGTGAPQRRADVAIDGDRIVAVGDVAVSAAARRTIDADGLLVTPGWVDIHTHYDGQATWDPDLAPSSINGVTSLVMGNCGVGFAPARPDRHDWLISLLEGVEDIPGTALNEGMTWGWESFREYLDVLDACAGPSTSAPRCPTPRCAPTSWASAGADHLTAALADEIAEMSPPRRGGDRAGCARVHHVADVGAPNQPRRADRHAHASTDEVLGIASALRRAGTGVVQLISDVYQSTDDDLVARELVLLRRLALEIGRPLSFTVQQNDQTPEPLPRAARRHRRDGTPPVPTVRAQVGVRPIGVLLGLTASAYPLARCPTYGPLRNLPLAERVAALRNPDGARGDPRRARRGRDGRFPGADPRRLRPHVPAQPTRPTTSQRPSDSVAGIAARHRAVSRARCCSTCCSTTAATGCCTCR